MQNIIKEIEKKIQSYPIMKELFEQNQLTKSYQSLSRFRSAFETQSSKNSKTSKYELYTL